MNSLSSSFPLPLLAVFAAAPFAHAIDATGWRFTQPVEAAPGALIALPLPDATLDAAQPDLADLRLVDAAGGEIPYILDAARFVGAREGARIRPAKTFSTRLDGNTTVILLETGLTEPVDGVDLITPAPAFLKPVRIEGSADGKTWTILAEGLPVFRQKNGAENLRVNFPAGAYAHLRLTVDDAKDDPAPFTGAIVRGVNTTLRAAEDSRLPVPVSILSREELPGKTRLTLDLGAAHLPLGGLTLDTPEPLFTRRVTVSVKEETESGARERTAAGGTLWAISGPGLESSAQRRLVLDFQNPARVIIVTIENGDSPPLAITDISADRRARRLVFTAPATPVRLLSGNPQAGAPRYDLALLSSKIKTASTASGVIGALNPNPGYKPFVPTPPPVIAGAPIDTGDWSFRKTVRMSAPGAQELELDLETLSRARRDLGDLRLVSGGVQVPFLLLNSPLTRQHKVETTELPPGKTAGVARYRIHLPDGSPPIIAVDFQGPASSFTRRVRLVMEMKSARDGVRTTTIAEQTWRDMGSPDAPDNTCTLRISPDTLKPAPAAESTTLILEIENGANAPIKPWDFRIHTPVTNLRFVAPTSGEVALYFGNSGAAAPSYDDLRLVAPRLISAKTSPATLGEITGDASGSAGKRYAGPILWVSLAGVVAGLLFVVSKMLPKADGKNR